MRSTKGSRRIVVRGVEYRWRAAGNDGYITLGVWPTNNVGPYIHGSFRYHETWVDNGNGSWSSAKDQIVITSRLVRRVIEYAIDRHGYEPRVKGTELNLKLLDHRVEWEDAIRAAVSAPVRGPLGAPGTDVTGVPGSRAS